MNKDHVPTGTGDRPVVLDTGDAALVISSLQLEVRGLRYELLRDLVALFDGHSPMNNRTTGGPKVREGRRKSTDRRPSHHHDAGARP